MHFKSLVKTIYRDFHLLIPKHISGYNNPYLELVTPPVIKLRARPPPASGRIQAGLGQVWKGFSNVLGRF